MIPLTQKPLNKLFRFILSANLALGILSYSSFAHAWGELGHQVMGEIAEKILSQDPRAKQALTRVLGVEPRAIAAAWPDEVRDDERFKPFAPYHFISIGADGKSHDEKNAHTILEQY